MKAQWLKILLFLLYLACDYRSIVDRIVSLELSPFLIAYIGLYALLAVALISAAFIPNTIARISVALAFACASIMLQSYVWTTHSPLDYDSFETMVASSGDMGEAVAQYGDILLRALLAASLLFAAIALPPKGFVLPFKLHWQLPAIAVAGLAGMLYLRGGEGSHALPAPFIPLAHASIKTALTFTEEGEPRRAVEFQPASSRPAQDIVLIVDESIAPNYLDINHADGVYSGLASAPEGLAIVNYGIAAAITNCSAGSNKTLRFGGTRENYRLIGKTYPSIWAYARKAGFHTVYLDGQRNNGELQNLATPEERAEIDDFVQLDGVSVIERDQTLARLIAERAANGRAEFIYVNKVGVHFPVADKFPDTMARFQPLPRRGATSHIIDMGPIHGTHTGTADEWRLYRNAYRNSVIWNVGQFFDALLPHIAHHKAVILYTADHGQDLHERNQPGKATHCTNDPTPEEGAAPLVVIDSAARPRLDWQAHLETNRNAMSHFRIFPTLLELMGYRRDDIAGIYGPSLIAPDKDAMTFTINYFAALGREPTWRKIDPAALATPPRTDFTRSAGSGADTVTKGPS